MSEKCFNTICDFCYEPANVVTFDGDRHIQHEFSAACEACWRKHLSIRSNEFGDLKCIERHCDEQLSPQIIINQLNIDAQTVSKWKKQSVENYQNRINLIKQNGLEHVCSEPNCLKPLYNRKIVKNNKEVELPPAAVIAVIVFMFVVFVNVIHHAPLCQKDKHDCKFVERFVHRPEVIIVSTLIAVCSLAILIKEVFKTVKSKYNDEVDEFTLTCCNGHVQKALPFDFDSRTKLETTRPCPNCYARIEKNRGCNRVTCSQCKTHFCYGCCSKGICKCSD